MALDDVSRRSLLEALAAVLAAAAVPPGLTAIAQAAHDTQMAPPVAGEPALSFLTATEAADIDAIAAQIIPTDDTPGAREAGVVYFVDRALATFLSQLAGDYRPQIAAFQAGCRERHPGAASFASLASEQQLEYLRAIDRTPFFATTHLLTLLGMFSLPAYGGNRGGVGWRLIGFEDRHSFRPPFGDYDRDYPGFVIDGVKGR
jgi:gluconate 2-dehydrogenase gamma chain